MLALRIMVDDIASGTLQPLLKILNGHLRSWKLVTRRRTQDPGIFMKLKIVGRSKTPLVSFPSPHKKRIGIFLQNKHIVSYLSSGRDDVLGFKIIFV